MEFSKGKGGNITAVIKGKGLVFHKGRGTKYRTWGGGVLGSRRRKKKKDVTTRYVRERNEGTA